jgi:hypothetical protein
MGGAPPTNQAAGRSSRADTCRWPGLPYCSENARVARERLTGQREPPAPSKSEPWPRRRSTAAAKRPHAQNPRGRPGLSHRCGPWTRSDGTNAAVPFWTLATADLYSRGGRGVTKSTEKVPGRPPQPK